MFVPGAPMSLSLFTTSFPPHTFTAIELLLFALLGAALGAFSLALAYCVRQVSGRPPPSAQSL
eukprot:3682435-Prymnesium_polylepis.1